MPDIENTETHKSWLGGCFISKINMSDLLKVIHSWIAEKERGHYITAINVSKLVMMQKDKKLADYILRSSINIADGFPIFLATRLLGNPVPERITGVELMERLLVQANKNKYRVFFLGAKPEILEQVLAKCAVEYPDLMICGSQDGYYDRSKEELVVQQVAASNPDLLLVAMGIPQKEYFIDDYHSELNAVLSLPVGGAFDVYAGVKSRAPAWVQKTGVEWLWRSLYDGSRARLIYKFIPTFFRIFIQELFNQRLSFKK